MTKSKLDGLCQPQHEHGACGVGMLVNIHGGKSHTLEFLGEDGRLTGMKVQEIDWKQNPDGGRPIMVEKGSPEVMRWPVALTLSCRNNDITS